MGQTNLKSPKLIICVIIINMITSSEKRNEKKVQRRHQRVWSFLRIVAPPFLRMKFGYSCELAPDISEPYLVLPNHNSDLDPAFVGFSFKKQMYFVASEHVYRRGFVSKLLFWAFEPIAKMKGASDTLTVMKAIRKLRTGQNVCLFPEGNRSFNGKTGAIFEATGKLVKTSGAALVTYKITGGYLSNPRWGFGIRKGKMHGSVVNVYSSSELKLMTPEEITNKIISDLDEDAYKRQSFENIAYKGKNLAYGFETAYCLCPICKNINVISSNKNSIYCSNCGKLTDILPTGFFSEGFQFKSASEWDEWQESYFEMMINDKRDRLICLFSDSNMDVHIVKAEHQQEDLGIGSISLFCDRIEISVGENLISLPYDKISDMSIYGKNNLVFTDSEGCHYEIVPCEKKSLKNMRKYLSIWKIKRSELTK